MRGVWGGWLIGLGLLAMPWDAAWAQACIGFPVQNNQTCNNSIALTNTSTFAGFNVGLQDGATLTLTNTASGTISGGLTNSAIGIYTVFDANVMNSGTISGTAGAGGFGYGIYANQDANVMNSGAISAAGHNTYGIFANRDISLTNSGIISATGGGGFSSAGSVGALRDVNVTNSGTISAAGAAANGVFASRDASVTNSGTISGIGSAGTSGHGTGISANRDVSVTNSGMITGTGGANASGIFANHDANITNTGTISGIGPVNGFGIGANHDANITNTGTISGIGGASGIGYGIYANHAANLTNSGTIFGSTYALFFAGNADTLTVLLGSRIIGAIMLGGGGDTVNFRGGNHNLSFDTLAGATVTGTTPFAVSGNQAAAVDLRSIATGWRTLADFTRAASDAVPVFSGNAPGGGGPLAFAGVEAPAPSRFDDAFASIPGLASAYAKEAMVFKAPTAVYADGTAIWARGFAGQRIQQQDGVLLRNLNVFYGGMIGGDWQTRPDLRLGVFLGGGKTRSSIDLNQGGTDSDLLFGGAYARYDVGASFLHSAVQAGSSRNAATRTINNNLLANGIEIATASYDGWYVSPEATFGHRFALGRLADAAYTLTPSLRIRYLYGAFGGYTETGTTAPLTIGGQTVSALEERGELKLTRSVALNPQNQLSTSITGGVLGTQRFGGNTINAALLGQAIPFATPGQSDVWGGFGGLGLEWRSRNVTFFSAAEYLALSDNSNIISGRTGLRVAF